MWLSAYNITLFHRKNQVFEFIPDRLPEFPLKKFEKVSGEAFFVDEHLLVYIDSFIIHSDADISTLIQMFSQILCS